MRRAQRGAFNVVAAATMLVGVLVIALALDTGRIYLEQERLQGAADAAALAAARELNNHADESEMLAAVRASVLDAASQNVSSGDFSAADAVAVGYIRQTATENRFEEGYASDGRYTAVRVHVHSTVPRSVVAPMLLPGTAALTATAVSQLEAVGQIEVGSYLVKAELLKPVLGKLLDADVTLFGYDQLLGAQLSLADLKAAVGADSLDDLLNANLSLGDFLRFSADALRRSGNELAAVQLNNFAAAASGSLRVKVGDLIAVTTDNPAVLDARLDAFGLLMASAQLANKNRQLDGIALNVGALGLPAGVTGVTLDLKVREAAQTVVGPPGLNPITNQWRTKAHNGQIDLTLRVNLIVGGLIKLQVQAAGADAWLKTVSGAKLSATEIPRASAQVGSATDPVSVKLALAGIPLLSADTGAVARDPISFTGPFPKTESVGTRWGPALAEMVRNARILGLPLPLAGVIAPLVGAVGTVVLEPLLQTLGIQLGGADVSVIYLDPGEPRLMQ